ncbi:MAG: molybdenum cofactor cytidylyltransferase [Roseibaca calidilacus]|uniref:CTP:molybdopterin cytidylyltransferase MocA n=1 Tax=Roseibaca calidilacus TaxID=1666912 RepID=A0A0P7YUP1_9RHOB|nr:nucleotidyltransferase family protein [Roseibaca calidilacus]KPP94234.1 MAG: molybdenum cofactor cytidylyltransferase [Roseibaca calidilacus]CUX81331.1 CTP:molybdopterin cytidylyltransferase MocA [Roseibaca calidilacus]
MSRAILLPAAGASRRMQGRDKLLELVDGVPLIRRAALRAMATGARVLVTLPMGSQRHDVLAGLSVSIAEIDATEGMAASLRAGGAWASDSGASALMVALPDMPDITSQDMSLLFTVQEATPDAPLRATTESGAPGHPVILPRGLFSAMAGLQGDAGARAILVDHPPRLHPLPGQRALTDLDTPKAWAAWRAKR